MFATDHGKVQLQDLLLLDSRYCVQQNVCGVTRRFEHSEAHIILVASCSVSLKGAVFKPSLRESRYDKV
jgi:hypothetical protein